MRHLIIFTLGLVSISQLSAEVDFTQDIRPLLSDRCFFCHGPDKSTREANLRLDTREGALADNDGVKAIVPGKPDASELLYRISTDDKDDLMPPTKHNKEPFNKKEVALFKQWIQEGANYEEHWSYRTVAETQPPKAKDSKKFVKTPIDAFILSKANQSKFQPSKEADPVTLARRLFFDLVGMPPRHSEIEFFLKDPSDANYKKLVDRLMADKRFGERMAVYWLDLVRFSDTIGYHSDVFMEVSAYRDYVIDAFNNNLPYDQFAIENLAGDLLPEATIEQKIASGYNRLLQTTEEGGAQADEYITIYQADRVRNFSNVWIGSTMGCSQCHDHKYDPFTIKDFYSMASFFADIKEKPLGRRSPNLKLPTDEQQSKMDDLRKKISETEKKAKPLLAELKKKREALQKEINEEADKIKYTEPGPDLDNSDAKKADPSDPAQSLAAWIKKNKGNNKVPKPVLDAIKLPSDKQNDNHKKTIHRHYITKVYGATKDKFTKKTQQVAEIVKEEAKHNGEIKKLKDSLAAEDKRVRTMLVSEPTKPRMVKILPRGNWLDKSGAEVQPAIPEFLGKLDTGERRANRLDLAKWVVAKDNPLTARTHVNRLWKLFMGRGLSRLLDDLGGQGEPPTHPELLDWLAKDFQNNGWDQKRAIRQMLLSSTYRQSSAVSQEMQEKDPANRLYLRQDRFRLDAEFVRDSALHLSGLLKDEVGGRSVKPYQPAGYWQHLNFPRRTWKADTGDALYRRSVYTFRCRSFPHPAMVAFDAPSREECTAERPRSNIPQQALVLLNDPTFVEASKVFAERILREVKSKKAEDRIGWAFQQMLTREPTKQESQILGQFFTSQEQRYKGDPNAAKELLATGASPAPTDLNTSELAAWTSLSRALFNLYETTSRY